jgi:hypothetical protein
MESTYFFKHKRVECHSAFIFFSRQFIIQYISFKILSNIKEFLYRFWLRSQIFHRSIQKIKNFKFAKKNDQRKIIFFNLINKILFAKFWDNFFKNIPFFSPDLSFYLLISKNFLQNLKRLEIFFEKKNLFLDSQELKISNLLGKSQECCYVKNSETMPLFLGKFIIVEGIIVQMKELKHIIFSILIECKECESIFYCFFDSFLDFKPFMCIKFNCRSQNFFSHKNKLCSITWRKIRIQKENKNLKKKTKKGFIDIELVGKKLINLKTGNKIQIRGVLKIQKFTNNLKIFSFFRNIFVFYILGQTLVSDHKRRISSSKSFLKKKEYLFFSKFKKIKNLFGRLMKSLNFLGKNNNSFKAFLLFSLNFNKKELKRKPCFVNVFLDEKNPKNNHFFPKIAHFLTNGFLLREISFLSAGHFFPKNFREIWESKFLEEVGNYPLLIQTLIPQSEFCIDTWRENIDSSLIYKYKKKKLPNFIFIEFKKEKKTQLLNNSMFSFYPKGSIRDPGFTLKIRGSRTKIDFKVNSDRKKKNISMKTKNEPSKKNFFANSKIYPLLNRKFSKFILRRFLSYLKNFKTPLLPDKTKNFLIGFYVFLGKNSKKCFFCNKITFLEISILFSKTRAKLSLREKVSINDVLDSIEIISYPKKTFKKILENFIIFNGTKSSKKVFEIIRFLKILTKPTFRGKRNIFNFQEISQKIEHNNGYYGFSDFVDFLEEYGLVQKFGKKFFRIINI